MASKYTEEQLNSLDRETLIRLFLSQQEQLENIDHTLQLVLEQMADLKRHRFGRSSEKQETEGQVSFMEVDGKIVFFNESEAVAAEESTEEPENVSRTRPKKKQGKREEDLDGIPVVVVEHSMTAGELEDKFGKDGWKLYLLSISKAKRLPFVLRGGKFIIFSRLRNLKMRLFLFLTDCLPKSWQIQYTHLKTERFSTGKP